MLYVLFRSLFDYYTDLIFFLYSFVYNIFILRIYAYGLKTECHFIIHLQIKKSEDNYFIVPYLAKESKAVTQSCAQCSDI